MALGKLGLNWRMLAGLLGSIGLFAVSGTAAAEWGLNLPEGVTEISREVFELHMRIFWICVVIGVLVFGVMFFSVFKHRKAAGAKAAQFHHSTTVEVIWTVIPFVILIVMAIPAADTLLKMENTQNAEMTVKITGYQWKWRYDYEGEGVGYYSTLDAESNKVRQTGSNLNPADVEHYLLNVDRPLVIPEDTKIRLLVTAADVIHAWWVPDFAVKKDAIPGFVNETWVKVDEPGTYRGQCAELCGRDHGFMPIVVIVKTKEDYAKWLAEQKVAANPSNPAVQIAAANQ